MEFGDLNLRDGCCRTGPGGGSLGAGKGGWPTIRYFNSQTGPDGAAYTKVTQKPMCTELGPGLPHLKDYIEGYGKTSVDKKASTPDAVATESASEL